MSTVFNGREEILNELQEKTAGELWKIARSVDAVQAALFLCIQDKGKRYLKYLAGYAYHLPVSEIADFAMGEGLTGQVAKERKLLRINNLPPGYICIISGLGAGNPSSLIIAPVLVGSELFGVLEIAAFRQFTEEDERTITDGLHPLIALLETHSSDVQNY